MPNLYACKCGIGTTTDSAVAMKHIATCQGPLAVYAEGQTPMTVFHEPKGPGEVQVHEGAWLYLSSDGKVGFLIETDSNPK